MKSVCWTTSRGGDGGRLRRSRNRADGGHTFRGDGVVAPMAVAAAGFALFLDVRHFPTRGNLAIPADHAPARESCEAEQTNETHWGTLRRQPNDQLLSNMYAGDKTRERPRVYTRSVERVVRDWPTRFNREVRFARDDWIDLQFFGGKKNRRLGFSPNRRFELTRPAD